MTIIESNDPLATLVSIHNITIEVNGGTVFITEDGSERVIRISISLSNWVTEDSYSAACQLLLQVKQTQNNTICKTDERLDSSCYFRDCHKIEVSVTTMISNQIYQI